MLQYHFRSVTRQSCSVLVQCPTLRDVHRDQTWASDKIMWRGGLRWGGSRLEALFMHRTTVGSRPLGALACPPWPEALPPRPVCLPAQQSSLNQRSMMSKHGEGASLRLSGGPRDGMDASINSDCSDDWFDYVEKTRASDPTP